jgi:hypothetical protein
MARFPRVMFSGGKELLDSSKILGLAEASNTSSIHGGYLSNMECYPQEEQSWGEQFSWCSSTSSNLGYP